MPLSTDEESNLVDRLRRGDEETFTRFVTEYSPAMLSVARRYVKHGGSAEEIVQETWLAVLQGIARYQARASLKSWIFAILVKRAITRGTRDNRQLPFSSLAHEELSRADPAVDPDRFAGPQAEWPRHWIVSPPHWSDQPEHAALGSEVRRMIDEALDALPPAQRMVVQLRDIAGHDCEEVAQALELSEGNVRVLLHRGRSKVRAALERYFTGIS